LGKGALIPEPEREPVGFIDKPIGGILVSALCGSEKWGLVWENCTQKHPWLLRRLHQNQRDFSKGEGLEVKGVERLQGQP